MPDANEEEKAVGQRMAAQLERGDGRVRHEVFPGERLDSYKAPRMLWFEHVAQLLIVEALTFLHEGIDSRGSCGILFSQSAHDFTSRFNIIAEFQSLAQVCLLFIKSPLCELQQAATNNVV
ncbi:MAG: hypothetical protein WKF74_02850 [Pyrinomonadaceae bacterium]